MVKKKQRLIYYEHMPENHSYILYIPDDLNTYLAYTRAIEWLKTMCTMEGTTFGGVRYLSDGQHGSASDPYPLVELVMGTNNATTKLLIQKNNLYIIAYFNTATGRWFQFDASSFKIYGFKFLDGFSERYSNSSEPWKSIGPVTMIGAIYSLGSVEFSFLNPLFHKPSIDYLIYHILEAVRFPCIELKVSNSLIHTLKSLHEITTTHKDEALMILDGSITEDQDIYYSSLRAKRMLDDTVKVEADDYYGKLVKDYVKLSKAWIRYSLIKKLFDGVNLERVDFRPWFNLEASEFELFRTVKSFHCYLGVLANVNCYKVIEELEKVFGVKVSKDVDPDPELLKDKKQMIDQFGKPEVKKRFQQLKDEIKELGAKKKILYDEKDT